MHGTRAFPDDVGRRFDKLDYTKIRLEYSTGLGVASRASSTIEVIEREWKQRLIPQGGTLRHVYFDELKLQP
jgi:hypothetical protein